MKAMLARDHARIYYIVVVLPDLAMDNAIHAFICGSQPQLKEFVKVQV